MIWYGRSVKVHRRLWASEAARIGTTECRKQLFVATSANPIYTPTVAHTMAH